MRDWLLFIYRVPAEPPGRRMHVWRQLKQLGATYLQQAAAIIPALPELEPSMAALDAWVRTHGGEASLLRTASPSLEWEASTISRFHEARAAEYAELIENAERFEDEITRETRRRKFTFAELEDLEADWEKLRRWRERIRARDFFDSAPRSEVDAVLSRAQASLAGFTAAVERAGAVDQDGGEQSRAEPA